jgi:hypothetical protein
MSKPEENGDFKLAELEKEDEDTNKPESSLRTLYLFADNVDL